MLFKKGTRLYGVRGELAAALVAIDDVYKDCGARLVVTSVMDSKHGDHSYHYEGAAADLRLPSRCGARKPDDEVSADIRFALTDEFDVVLEGDHIHVEFDVKRAVLMSAQKST
jgi:hypothetical protein